MECLVGIFFTLSNRESLVCCIVEGRYAAVQLQRVIGISFPPPDNIEEAMKFESEFDPSFMLDGSSHRGLVDARDIGQQSGGDRSITGLRTVVQETFPGPFSHLVKRQEGGGGLSQLVQGLRIE